MQNVVSIIVLHGTDTQSFLKEQQSIIDVIQVFTNLETYL